MRKALCVFAAISGLGLFAPTLALAAAGPFVLGPLYVEPSRSADAVAPPAGCPVRILELRDDRREPETVGAVVGFRAFKAPQDRQAWTRSIFEVGLKARGFTPLFVEAGTEGAADPASLAVKIRIHTIWMTLQAMNKIGAVAWRASITPPRGVAGPETIYRGDRIGTNMMGSQSEFNSHMNQVFALALDDFAADLRPLCPAR